MRYPSASECRKHQVTSFRAFRDVYQSVYDDLMREHGALFDPKELTWHVLHGDPQILTVLYERKLVLQQLLFMVEHRIELDWRRKSRLQ